MSAKPQTSGARAGTPGSEPRSRVSPLCIEGLFQNLNCKTGQSPHKVAVIEK